MTIYSLRTGKRSGGVHYTGPVGSVKYAAGALGWRSITIAMKTFFKRMIRTLSYSAITAMTYLRIMSGKGD